MCRRKYKNRRCGFYPLAAYTRQIWFVHLCTARVGLMHICVFILLLLSGERNFGKPAPCPTWASGTFPLKCIDVMFCAHTLRNIWLSLLSLSLSLSLSISLSLSLSLLFLSLGWLWLDGTNKSVAHDKRT